MGVVLNIAALLVTFAILHFSVTRGWSNGKHQILKRRLLNKAILPESERAGLNAERVLIFIVVLGPITLALGVLWLVPGALAWVSRSWGVLAALVLALAELGFFMASSALNEGAMADVYAETHPKFRKNLSGWQEKEVAPFREAWRKALAAAVAQEIKNIDAEDDDGPAGTTFEGRGSGGDEYAALGLEFEILQSWHGQQTLEGPPYFQAGGEWAVLKCRTRTEPPGTFWFAETSPVLSGDPPFAFGDGRMWTDSEFDAANLCRAVSAAFKPGAEISSIALPPGPLKFGTAVLSRSTAPLAGGGFAGTGSWTATKWTTEDGSEVFLNWSAASKRGNFSEKDECYADGVCEAFGARFPESKNTDALDSDGE
ncbi:MAG: hypothetical protein ABI565_11600 [Vicinamibacteria bacterium]